MSPSRCAIGSLSASMRAVGDSLLACAVGQAVQQQRSDPAPPPVVRHGDGDLGYGKVGVVALGL
jgi:hypothetical protein